MLQFLIFINRIKTLKSIIKYMFGVALVSILLMDLWLNDVYEFFRYGAKIGGIWYKICLSIISAIILYFVHTHSPKEQMKASLYRMLYNKTFNMERYKIEMLDVLVECSKKTIKYEITMDDIERICTNINPHEKLHYGQNVLPFDNWFKLFNFFHKQNKEIILDLLNVKECLDTDFISYLTNIDDVLENHINISKGEVYPDRDLIKYASGIYEYVKLVENLNIHFKDKYKLYEEEYHNTF